VRFDRATYDAIIRDFRPWFHLGQLPAPGPERTSIPDGITYEYAYHHLLVELVRRQERSLRAAMGEGTDFRKLYVDGGFSSNEVYIKLLAHRFRHLKLRTTDTSLGSALGAAIAISDTQLNSKFLKRNYGLRKHQPFILND
ncbi:MAG: carbohydrate kinase, partial [Bacteroidota bacterium]